jgi:hypothetical protein
VFAEARLRAQSPMMRMFTVYALNLADPDSDTEKSALGAAGRGAVPHWGGRELTTSEMDARHEDGEYSIGRTRCTPQNRQPDTHTPGTGCA